MEDLIVNTLPTPESRKEDRRVLVECGLWLRVGFIGASAVAAALIQLIDGDVKVSSALALAIGGAILAAACWWRTRTLLDQADGVAPATHAPSPAGDRTPLGA